MPFASGHGYRRWTGGVALIAALASLSTCRAPTDERDNRSDGGEPEVQQIPDPPQSRSPLDRKALLDAVAAAASAHATGADDGAAQAGLAGRRFAIRIPIGCQSLTDGASDRNFRISPRSDGSSFEVVATPNLSAADVGIAAGQVDAPDPAAAKSVESVEGFWIPRPWILTARCPIDRSISAAMPDDRTSDPADGGPPTSTDAVKPAQGDVAKQVDYKKVGIAQFFTASDSRVSHRSGRAYSKIEPIGEAGLPTDGLILLLEGRLRPWPSGKVIRCQGSGRNSPPSCVVSGLFDRVAFERPADGTVIAEWRN
jgi:hypothetical protein